MRAKSRVLRRINLLYTLFFAALVLAIVSAVLKDEYQAAFMDGWRQGMSSAAGEQPSTTIYEVDNRVSTLDYDIPLPTNRPDVEARAKIDTFNVYLTGRSSTTEGAWSTTLSLLAVLCYGAIFVLIFLILKS